MHVLNPELGDKPEEVKLTPRMQFGELPKEFYLNYE
jgi:hypothetical protein